ncbi:MAG: O-sialoglycoprotein endopeptidase [Clostridia bacterium]|nr:O-sialoglycoprotein endopeptidase [Clostridia bacterium]
MEQKRKFIGIDTSCYTSSAACVCVNGIVSDKRQLLPVGSGERGLRQSDAVFLHTRNLQTIVPELLSSVDPAEIAAVGVSVCPSGRDGSYMPVFLVGKLVASSVAAALRCPVYGFTHQQGHIRAALFGNEDLIGKEFFAFHLSGGTSDLIRVDGELNIERIGGSTDINAGQLVDRLGVKLGLGFPAGKAMEELASKADGRGVMLPSSVKGLDFSFSGAETKAAKAIGGGADPAKTAYSVYDLVARTLAKTMINAMNGAERPDSGDFLLAGGVASSALLRSMLRERMKGSGARLRFAEPALSSDNAVGAALLAMDAFKNQNPNED